MPDALPWVRWVLRVQFDSAKAQNRVFPAFPEGELHAATREITRLWGADLEPGDVIVQGSTLTVRADIMDSLTSIVSWILMYTIPVRVELTRTESR